MLEFPYQAVPSAKGPPRWRPLVPVRLLAASGRSQLFGKALLDTGADDTVFPRSAALALQITLAGTGKTLLWRGQAYAVESAHVELELKIQNSVWRWPATLLFSVAPIAYPLLGQGGSLEYLDAEFLGAARRTRLRTNSAYSGTAS